MKGNEVNYNLIIGLNYGSTIDLQYITFPGNVTSDNLIFKSPQGISLLPYNNDMKIRDVYNYVIALLGYRPGLTISRSKGGLSLDGPNTLRSLRVERYFQGLTALPLKPIALLETHYES